LSGGKLVGRLGDLEQEQQNGQSTANG
jgi:hypothetical protein